MLQRQLSKVAVLRSSFWLILCSCVFNRVSCVVCLLGVFPSCILIVFKNVIYFEGSNCKKLYLWCENVSFIFLSCTEEKWVPPVQIKVCRQQDYAMIWLLVLKVPEDHFLVLAIIGKCCNPPGIWILMQAKLYVVRACIWGSCLVSEQFFPCFSCIQHRRISQSLPSAASMSPAVSVVIQGERKSVQNEMCGVLEFSCLISPFIFLKEDCSPHDSENYLYSCSFISHSLPCINIIAHLKLNADGLWGCTRGPSTLKPSSMAFL